MTSESGGRRWFPEHRGWFALIVIFVLVAVAVRSLDTVTPIWSYRVVDDHTIEVQTVGGPGTWTRVTSVDETGEIVLVGISSLRAPLPGASDDISWFRLTLRDPIADRLVIDMSSGQPIARTAG